jgi:DNA-binding transcriptional LysR family regulator
VAPFAAWLRSELPEVRIEIASTIQYLDLSRREADLALRFQLPLQRDLTCLATLDLEVAPFATADYVKTLRRGYTAADVAWIGWAPPFDHLSPNRELAAKIPGFVPVFTSDDFLIQLRAAEAGIGAIFLGRVRHRFSAPTSLVELDLDLGGVITSSLHLVCAKSALEIPRVRAVADLLVRELRHTEVKKRSPKRRA